jgi:hypothetical protein
MPDVAPRPRQLLKLARHIAGWGTGRPSVAVQGRAVSTSDYAFFHLLAGATSAAMFAGPAERRAYAAATQRGFTHTGLANVAEQLTRPDA